MGEKHTSKLLPTIVVVVVMLLGGAGVVLSKQLDSSQKAPAQTASTQTQHRSATPAVAAASTSTIEYDGQNGQTALALLQADATVVTKDSSYGPYVDSINGIKGGTDGKYWAFYINGTLSQVGAGAYTTKSGDKIQWKFE